jgi:hypothetical protein
MDPNCYPNYEGMVGAMSWRREPWENVMIEHVGEAISISQGFSERLFHSQNARTN